MKLQAPTPGNSPITHNEKPRVKCDRCGFTYREGELVTEPVTGLQVCHPVYGGHCYDDPAYKDGDY